jgi:chromosome segregation ATPase
MVPGSSAVHAPEDTRISDSMPGTAASENARLAADLDKVSTTLHQEREKRREEAVMWDRQQTEHENRQEQYRKLFNEKAAVDHELKTMSDSRDQLRGKMNAQLDEIGRVREELEALRAFNSTSADEKDVEIIRLRKELEDAKVELEKARKSAKTQDETMDFLKEQYRKAQVIAGQAQSEVETLASTNAKLSQQASGEAARLKQMHLDRSAKNLMQQNKALQSENAVLKHRLKTVEEELARAKNNSGRSAYGTRGQSTTPQPKTRSRAASPAGGPRVARGGGRISNLVAEGM